MVEPLGAVRPAQHDSVGGAGPGAHLIERSTIEMTEARNGLSIIGCDAANGTCYQLYSEDRGVCRVYEMSVGDGEWRLWREGQPFAQRFTGRFEDDGNTIVGRREKADDVEHYTTHFDLIYRKGQVRRRAPGLEAAHEN
jgi:hypothetical protein